MESKKEFCFETPVVSQFGRIKGKVLCYVQISGIAEWDDSKTIDYWNEEFELKDVVTIDIQEVILYGDGKEEVATYAYNISKQLGDEFADIVNSATLAHMEYIFAKKMIETIEPE